ncbi:MAG: hypothetical protein QM536_05390 [Chitinophagaceae bacterium]|nr:hypothetical protein [Chitinophagaceae bacterium]
MSKNTVALVWGIVILCGIINNVSAQEKKTENEEEFSFEPKYESPLKIELKTEDSTKVIPLEEKKKKKRIFWGIKTKKGYTISRVRKNGVKTVTVELFYYIKKYQEPQPYIRNIYWFHKGKRKIIISRNVHKKRGKLLHGPYKKTIGEQVVEEGFFYKGMKHGRWMQFNTKNILISKKKYYKGLFSETKMSYYDVEKTKIKEILPIENDEKNGRYYAFHENGELAAEGEYLFNKRVGIWTEYYDNKKKKREIQYPKDPFDKEYSSYITQEWNQKGKLIYTNPLYKPPKKK